MSSEAQNQIEKILKELGQKIEHLVTEARGATGEMRDEIEESIKSLKKRRENLEQEYEEFKKKNEGKWEEIKSHLTNAADEIKLAAEAVFKKKN